MSQGEFCASDFLAEANHSAFADFGQCLLGPVEVLTLGHLRVS